MIAYVTTTEAPGEVHLHHDGALVARLRLQLRFLRPRWYVFPPSGDKPHEPVGYETPTEAVLVAISAAR